MIDSYDRAANYFCGSSKINLGQLLRSKLDENKSSESCKSTMNSSEEEKATSFSRSMTITTNLEISDSLMLVTLQRLLLDSRAQAIGDFRRATGCDLKDALTFCNNLQRKIQERGLWSYQRA